MIDAVKLVLPDFQSLNLSTETTYDVTIPMHYIGAASWYAASYVGLTLIATIVILSRRDFT